MDLVIGGDLAVVHAVDSVYGQSLPVVPPWHHCEAFATAVLRRRRGCAARPLGSEPEAIGPEVGSTRRVVEQVHTADDQPGRVVDVVLVFHVQRFASLTTLDTTDICTVGAHDADNPSVVGHDHVRVVGVAVRRHGIARIDSAIVVAGGVLAAAAEEQIGAVRSLGCFVEIEVIGVAAHDVVLIEASEHRVVACVALDVVLAVGEFFVERWDQIEVADQVTGIGVRGVVVKGITRSRAAVRRARGTGVDRYGNIVNHACEGALGTAITFHDVVAHLTEDQVVRLAAGDVVVAEAARALDPVVDVEGVEVIVVGVVLVEEDLVLSPPWIVVYSGAVSIAEVTICAIDQEDAAVVGVDRVAALIVVINVHSIRAAIQQLPAQRLEAEAGDDDLPCPVGLSWDGRIGDPPVQEDLVAEDQIVVLIAVEQVVVGTADDHIAPHVAEDDIVVAVLVGARFDLTH